MLLKHSHYPRWGFINILITLDVALHSISFIFCRPGKRRNAGLKLMFPKNARRDVKMGDKAARGPPPAFNTVQNSFAQIHSIILTEKHIFPKNAQRDVKMGDKV